MLSQQGKTIQELPDELLVMIFSLLDEKSIFSCSLTCKKFALILQNYGHVILLDSWKNTVNNMPLRMKSLLLLKIAVGRFPEIDRLSIFSQTNKLPIHLVNGQLNDFFKRKHQLEFKLKKCDQKITGGEHPYRDLTIGFLLRSTPLVVGVGYSELTDNPIGYVVGMVMFILSVGKCMWNIVRDESNGIQESSSLTDELIDHLLESANKMKKMN